VSAPAYAKSTFSKNAEADLAFLNEVLGRPKAADAGGGWMIYALPPAEIAVHPADEGGTHKLYLMCDDVEDFREAMLARGTPVGEIAEQRWGRLVDVTMPGGGTLGVYQPLHASPHGRREKGARKAAARKSGKRPAARAKAAKGEKRASKKKRPAKRGKART
jgi:hypothetical protein